MFNTQKVFALIPARGGSKGIPRKNLSRIGGKTLIELAINSALGCSVIDAVFISTDDPEIAELGKSLGNTESVLPFSIIFDADGGILRQKLGKLTEDDLKSWRQSLA